MKNEYYIIGAGGFAKEVFFLTQEVLGETSLFKGFIDHDSRKTYLNVQEKKMPIIEYIKTTKQIKSAHYGMTWDASDWTNYESENSCFKELIWPNGDPWKNASDLLNNILKQD